MKKITSFLFVIGAASLFAGLVLTGCTKSGPAGKDANATCTQCHTFADTIVAKIFQYDASKHASGSTAFEGTNKSCAPCHASQGFDEVVVTGADTTKTGIADAAPINCRTCHKIHNSYTSSDWDLKTTAAFSPRYDHTASIDLAFNGGSSNLCARCHQARAASPGLTNPTSNVDSIKITSGRWGPHHGPQGLIMAGKGAFEVGAAAFGNSPHRDQAACMTCHGGYAQGNFVGGHTLTMTTTSDNLGDNYTVCKPCHASASATTGFNIGGVQDEIEGMMQDLKVKLAAANVLDTTTMFIKVPKYYKQKQLAVYWNFQLIEADRSMGVHNYQYTYDILQSGIDYMNSLGL
ncbi:MAG: hypothetical protein NTX61_06015 [Bacteroidetes bacterium]|nr:hypothetical protein [Bacteroidota bacterium]